MRLPTMRGIIGRRILANYRVDPDILARQLPAPFKPKLHRGYGIAGICLIRLSELHPSFLPSWLGTGSENAAHRIAVEWSDAGVAREGVFVCRRDSNSWVNSLAGGRLFPGIQHHAAFNAVESETHIELAMKSDDGLTRISIEADVAAALPGRSGFTSLHEASEFFRGGALGYSPANEPQRFHGIELNCDTWSVEPLAVTSVHSSFFEDAAKFPAGSAEFDCALLMRGISHQWESRPDLQCCEV